MEVNEIKRLLDAFYNAETTQDEERLLFEYFQGKDVDEELLEEKALFLDFYKHDPIDVPAGLGRKLENLIDELETKKEEAKLVIPQQNKRTLLRWVGGIAAGIAILITAGLVFNKQSETENPSLAQSPAETVNKEDERKIKEAQDALVLLSTKFNEGMGQLASVSMNLDKTNEILNKTFNQKNNKEL